MTDQDTQKPQQNADMQTSTDKLIENLLNLVETYLKIIQLEVRGSIASTLSITIILIIASIAVSFAVLMLSIGSAYLLSAKLEIGVYTGFFIVAVVYIILLLLVLASRKKLQLKIDEIIAKQIQNTKKNKIS